ncbi:HlyD family type I secretion periplasmic adaptor subunit [Ensifer sp. Root127]|uniref:HlyD family type I secretion periplasmic adaptor subunit n=1 Tax=Ensifer sp. Root127 TaxID=1736440 RepID=UPI00070A503F|nr:HlyD family type I secretion periplasmic adaptor subunit [Ensifer sp. Root127]KQW54794.1 hypothetical protein ASD03_19700 [Ensifer sp. Root127]
MHSDTGGYLDHDASLRRHRQVGVTLILFFVCTFGIWAARAPLSSAVVASGQFVVDGKTKKVQHQTGGIIAEILVQEGKRVTEGQIILRLDATTAQSDLQIIERQLADLEMTEARLRAERDGLEHFVPPAHLSKARDSTFTGALRQREERMMKARGDARFGQESGLTERIRQLTNQIEGMEAQSRAKSRQKDIVAKELANLHTLRDRKLVLESQVNVQERSFTQLEGEIGELLASTAEVRAKIAETKLQILNIDQIAIADASRELAAVESRLSELRGKRDQAEDALVRIDIKAPRSGFVHELSVHTIGGVVGPGEVLMMIVPDHAPLNVEARIGPQEIDSIRLSDKGYVRIVGLNHSTTPDLAAEVTMVGADLVQDQTTRVVYYPVHLKLGPGAIGTLGGPHLVPGMPVDVFITTSSRTFLEYLWQPLRDRISRAVRER